MSASEPALDLCDFTTQTPWERFSADIAYHLRALPAAAESGGVYRARVAATGLTLAQPAAPHFDLVGVRVPPSGADGTIAPNARDLFAPDVVQGAGAAGAHFALYRCSGPAHDAFRPRWCVELRAPDMPDTPDMPDARDVPLLLSALVCGANDALLDDALLAVTDARGGGAAAAGYQLAPRSARHGPLVAGTERVAGAPERLCFLDGLFRYTLGKFTAVGSVEGAVAVQFLYVLRAYACEEWRTLRPRGSSSSLDGASPGTGTEGAGRALLWGPAEDPVQQLSLALQWQGDHPGEDTQAFSEYDSRSASRWVLRAGFAPLPWRTGTGAGTGTLPLLAGAVRALLRACRDCAGFAAVAQITGTSHVADSQTVLTCAGAAAAPGAVHEACVGALLDDVFAAAAGSSAHGPGTPPAGARRDARTTLRGAAPGSLLERFALCVLAARKLRSVMCLWLAFVARVRATVERGTPLPGTGCTPLYTDCLIEQKLCSVCSSRTSRTGHACCFGTHTHLTPTTTR